MLLKGFKKIRYFGIFSSGLKAKYTQLAQELLGVVKEQAEQIAAACNDLLEFFLSVLYARLYFVCCRII